MADRNEFLKGYRAFRSQKGGKPPPVDSQKVDTFKPQEYKRSAFAESYFQYQGMMNKELERINKEAEKAEQDIIKQQQQEGAGLGAGAQLGDPTMAPEPLSPETGTITPPSGLEQLYQQSVPPDLQQTAFPQPGALQPAPEAAPTEPAPLLSEQLPLMQPAHEQLAALGDVAGAFGTGMAAFLPSMLGGYLEGTIPTAFPQVGVPPQPAPREPLTSKEKAEAVTEVQDTIAAELSYMPRTKLGMEATETLSWPFEKVQQFATWSSSNIVPETQPFLRKIVEDVIHLGTYIVAHKTARIGTQTFKRGVSKYRGLPEERITVKNIEADIKSAQDKLPKKIKDKTTTFLKNIKEEVTENLKTREQIPLERKAPAVKKPPVPAEEVKKPALERKIPVKGKQLAKDVVEEAGGQYIGIRKGKEGVIPDYITFNEKTTGTTIEIPLSEVTPERIRAELAKKVEAYRVAEIPKPRTKAEMKAATEEAGAMWGGITIKEGKEVAVTTPTVVKGKNRWSFNSPYTKSTLMLKEELFTTEAVKAKMLENYIGTKKAGGEIVKLWKEGEEAFAQQTVEGVKPAAPEPTKPPAKLVEIPKEEFHIVKSGDKKDVAKEFITLSKRAPDTLSDVPKDQPTWIKVEHEGTTFTIPNTNYALETFAKKIGRLKEGKIGPPEPPRKERPIVEASGTRPKVDVDAGDTFIRIFDKDTKFKTPPEKEVWQPKTQTIKEGGNPYLLRGKVGKRTFFSDGHIVEFREGAPIPKIKRLVFEEATKDIAEIVDGWKGKDTHKPAKAVFDTEHGVAIMNKENGFFVSHNYFDYIRQKYGPKVQWEIPKPGEGLPGEGLPITFSVDGKLQGYLMPFDPTFTKMKGGYTPHNVLASRFPKGFPGPTLEAGGFQTMYEGIRDVIKSPKFFESTYLKAKGAKEFVIDEIVDPLRFYPHLPKDYVNDVRVHMVAALDRARHKVYSKEGYAGRIFKDMKKDNVYNVVELIYARDEVGRQKAGRGNPELVLPEATKIRDTLETSASAETLRAADEWRAVTNEVQADLVRRGVLRGPDPKTGYEGQFIEDYAPHAVGVYTPEWAYTVGIPTRLRTPFRSFKQKAKGTVKEIVKDADTLLGHLLKVEHTNMVEDFIIRETAKYDIIPTMSKKQKIALFGSRTHERLVKSKAYPEGIMKEIEVVNTPKPGRLWTEEELAKVDPSFKGKGDHWSYTPDQPFSRTIYMTNEGQMALGRYKNVSLIPADIFRSFKSFSESGSPLVHRMNLITGYWKNMAILSHYPSFNMNNLIGDTFMVAIQHPQPTRLLIEMETSLKYLMNEARAKPHTGHLKELHEFILSEDILGASFFMTELPKQIKGSKNPLRMILDKSMTVSQMREGINRTAYASTLLKSMKEGTASEMIKAHSWIDTKGLDQKAALGKIAREVLVDYAAVSKGFRRIGRGMLTPFGCVDDKTECLTDRGWKRYDELKAKKDRIWSFNLEKGICQWSTLEGVFTSHGYDDTMIEVTNRSCNAFTTPCHSTVIQNRDGKYKVVEAEELLTLPLDSKIPIVANPQEQIGLLAEDNLIKLLGWYLTDATLQKGGAVVIYQSKPGYVKEIRRLLKGLDINFAESIGKPQASSYGKLKKYRFRIAKEDAKIITRIQPVRKLTPELIVMLSSHQKRILIEHMLRGDGSKDKSNGRWKIFVRQNKEQQDLFQMLCTTAGIASRTSTKGVFLQHNTARAIKRSNIRLVKESDYKGTVWCPKTGTGYWLARRNNNIFITGNTWYFHNSRLVHRWMWKNKGKALVGMFAAPLAAQAWNNRNEEARQRELRRPDWLRNKIHFDIEETPAGDARTWALQLPQDVLIGTKIFTIATEMASRVYRGEINPANGKPWTPRDAALRTIKEWGVQEYRGVAYLMAPLIRFYIGLKDRRDPYDKVPIYSAEYNSLNPMQRKWEGAQFFVKTMVPFLGANIIKTQQKKQPIDIAFRRFLDNFIGKEAIGIFDMTPKGEIRLGNGKVYTMDDTARIKWVSNQALQYFNDIERTYIGFRGTNQEFVQSDKFTNTLVEMYDMMGQIDPKLFKPELDKKAKAGIMSQLYGERLVNMLIDPGTQQNRLEVMIERAKTDEERKQIREEYEKQRQARIFLGLRRQPKMERELMFKRKMDGSTLPWQLELYMPP